MKNVCSVKQVSCWDFLAYINIKSLFVLSKNVIRIKCFQIALFHGYKTYIPRILFIVKVVLSWSFKLF